ncbi:fungal-specific transcription factor domain-containing protein [Elsinoe ampelina]|uniref:Fungal-specific transcription factor domain-containing protein n=1 Tax=Elsinoe ampelina TaxID=302913 RepID=A0A6A6G8G7_9PEZI|nr:fungal-specific transcription factor domain-containing protein [Elsinoe ampelina]
MPGILPMKVIKMGTNAHMRIAQACDRCRSKKIRCDGIRPCCTQCANVGFECKTSDKLSRRAFPRGYTESLEERVRVLETEVRELKDLLDEKDEKIDMLTRIHPHRHSPPSQLPSPKASISAPSSGGASPQAVDDVTFTVQQSPYLTADGSDDSYFVGTSSASSFLESFKQKVQEKGRSSTDVKPSNLLKTAAKQNAKSISAVLSPLQSRPPPRLVSDQYVNIFFQEWAPLFPVLHRPTFLGLYEQFTSSPETITDKKSIAQLYLVFGLAALSQNSQQASEVSSFELQWQSALQQVQTEQSLATLQCLLLAQLFCMQKGDCAQLLTYKALAVSLSARLGLHQSQKRYAFGTLTCETRKKVFWTLYTLDNFSAVILGLPKQIRDDEVFCEYPVDADDEYITEKGFQPLLPGESTRVSSALALFRAARILSKVLEQLYPALPSYDLSMKKLAELSEELDQWQASLAPHLRLPFAQDKPTVGTVSSRSPLLSLTYHYIRTLIHCPAACSAVDGTSSSMIALAGSSKHLAQILALLTERGLSFSFCLNKEELLVLAGFGSLMQTLDLEDGSKVLRDNQKTLALIISQLDQMKASVASEFRRVACSYLPTSRRAPSNSSSSSSSRHGSLGSMPAPHHSTIPAAVKQHFKAMTSKFWPDRTNEHAHLQRRMTSAGPYRHNSHAQSVPALSPGEQPRLPRSEPARSPQDTHSVLNNSSHRLSASPTHQQPIHQKQPRASLNLDYLSFSSGATTPTVAAPVKNANQSDWERLLANLDNGQTNIFDNIYGGPPMEMLQESHKATPQQPIQSVSTSDLEGTLGWDPSIWAVTASDLTPVHTNQTTTESVASLSSSDESRGSVMPQTLGFDDLGNIDDLESYGGLIMPEVANSDDGLWDDRLDNTFVLA